MAWIYRRSLSYFKPERHLILAWLLTIALSIGVGLLQAWPTAILFDAVLSPKSLTSRDFFHWLFLASLPNNKLAQVVGLALIAMLLKIMLDVMSLAKNMLNNTINNYGTMRVRRSLYHKLMMLDMQFHRTQPQGDAIYRLSADAMGPQTIMNVLVNGLVSAVTLAVMGGAMLLYSWSLTVVALSVTPLLILTNLYFGPRIKRRTIDAKRVDAEMTTTLQRSMTLVSLIQAFRRERQENAGFQKITLRSARSWLRLNWQENGYGLASATIFSVAGAIIFGYGGYLVYRDQFLHPIAAGVTVGTLIVFNDYVRKLWDPLATLTSIARDIQPGVAGAERVFEILDHPIRLGGPVHPQKLPAGPSDLELRDVHFGYQPHELVVRGVSATIEAGSFVAFVGRSGAGKSSLLNLLPRFDDPTVGAILLGGRDLRSLRLEDLRAYVALVPQESPLMAASIGENIAYGRPDATHAEIRKAAVAAGAAEFINELPDAYDTLLTEGGSNLSGGQRQRVAIARALLTNASVVVLDEPTSALDPHSERRIAAAMASLRGERTVILVTHRLASVEACDQIFVMDHGQIVEQGTHAELLAHGGLYAEMWEEQRRIGTGSGTIRAA